MKHQKLYHLVLAALFAALTYVATNIIHVPIPATDGYINLGDCVVLLGAFLLGPVYGAAAVRFGMGTGLYCILGLIGKSFVVDGAIENIRLRKVCTIMTANPQPILDFIIHDMNRSATVEKAYGAYTHHELSVLVTVLTRRQALQLRNFLRENDPHSFITIVNSSEIIGKGFRSFN